mgnify:CR=1 FL=1|tara:strand:- start:370 stop:1077 length:708 start_codon:yes stop_codon:yes gene_type:complete
MKRTKLRKRRITRRKSKRKKRRNRTKNKRGGETTPSNNKIMGDMDNVMYFLNLNLNNMRNKKNEVERIQNDMKGLQNDIDQNMKTLKDIMTPVINEAFSNPDHTVLMEYYNKYLNGDRISKENKHVLEDLRDDIRKELGIKSGGGIGDRGVSRKPIPETKDELTKIYKEIKTKFFRWNKNVKSLKTAENKLNEKIEDMKNHVEEMNTKKEKLIGLTDEYSTKTFFSNTIEMSTKQ